MSSAALFLEREIACFPSCSVMMGIWKRIRVDLLQLRGRWDWEDELNHGSNSGSQACFGAVVYHIRRHWNAAATDEHFIQFLTVKNILWINTVTVGHKPSPDLVRVSTFRFCLS